MSGNNYSSAESHSQAPTPLANAEPSILIDENLIPALREVADPEVGVNIVDLGLVYRAMWTTNGISVHMTMTSPSCPMAEMLVDDVRVHCIDISRTPQRPSESARIRSGLRPA